MQDLILHLHKCASTGVLHAAEPNNGEAELGSFVECEVLDFKRQAPSDAGEYAKVVRDLIALHNSYGGFIVFGVEEVVKDREFATCGVEPGSINPARLRDLSRTYTDSDIRITVSPLVIQGKHTEVAWVAKRPEKSLPVYFKKNGPEISPGKLCFKKGELVFRRIDNNATASHPEDYEFLHSPRIAPSIDLPASEVIARPPLENSLPDRALVCSEFIGRSEDLLDLWMWLQDDFSRVRLIAGEGGLGKTSLAYHFAQEIAKQRVTPFSQVIWLTAKKRQFIAQQDKYQEDRITDFSCAESLFKSISLAHGNIDSDFEELDTREIQQLALASCNSNSSFIVVDDVDSLTPEDQQRALELGMRVNGNTKILITTRVNFSYSPDNVLKLDGLPEAEFLEYVKVMRIKYSLPELKDSKIDHIREVTGGSPLFTDSLLRLERRGLPLENAIKQWRGQKGIEARKAALLREVQQLSRDAKRTLFVICVLRNPSYAELSQALSYTDQTLGDALQELTGLFLISAPSVGREARYTVDPNTAKLVSELEQSLEIDHAALRSGISRAGRDAVGISMNKRSGIVGQAISHATALLNSGDPSGAVKAISDAQKKLSTPHPDLLLAEGRFNLNLEPPYHDNASKAFSAAYKLGQRKKILFDLWFETEMARNSLEQAIEIARGALDLQIGDSCDWHEALARAYVSLAQKASANKSTDASVRHAEAAIESLEQASKAAKGEIRQRRVNRLLAQARNLRSQLRDRS